MQAGQGRMGKKRRQRVQSVKRRGKMEEGKEEARTAGNKRPEGPSRPGWGGRAGKEWGVQNPGVSFLNLLGVCVSNKDKGDNDYSVKSMVLDCTNTN